jgi:hypothetical protein
MEHGDLEARIVQLGSPTAAVPLFVTLGNALESALLTLGEAVAAAHAPSK